MRGAVFALHYRFAIKGKARLGLVIAKKQAKTAVLRNAIKRQTRELFRQRLHGLPAFDVIVRLAQPVCPERPVCKDDKAGWRRELDTLFDQLTRKWSA